MFKKLSFMMALLLLSGIADGANPSATLSVQIVPAVSQNPQAIASVSLTNGPPNLPNASPCNPTTCAWMPSNAPSGSHVSLVYADPASNGTVSAPIYFTGSFALSGSDAGSFSISTTTDSFGRSVGEIKTASSLTSNHDYSITVTAVGASGSNGQNVTVHSAGCNSTPSPGTNTIPNTSGTICLGSGTYTLTSQRAPVSNSILLGIGNGASVINGSSIDNWTTNSHDSGATNVSIIGVAYQHSMGHFGNTGDIVRNSSVLQDGAVTTSGGGGFLPVGGAYINNIVNTPAANVGFLLVFDSAGSKIWGNEILQVNATLHDDVCAQGAVIYGNGAADMRYNYIHDNQTQVIHTDTANSGNGTQTIIGNTIINNGLGPFKETSSGDPWDFQYNVLRDNGNGHTFNSFGCTTPPINPGTGCCTSSPSPDLWIGGSSDVVVQNNNFSTQLGPTGYPSEPLRFDTHCNPNPPDMSNVVIQNNTVTFRTPNTDAYYAGLLNSGSCVPTSLSGSFSNSNTFEFVSGATANDARFQWFNMGGQASFSSYRSQSGQDASSATGTTDMSAAGCTHVACASNPVGAGGNL